ncbi:hypothetical protein SAMN05216317_1287 [Nitrosomonas eutropha]|uniref:Uncharacterized protein n=1 Tax=Nitrosomonas eutropha TaxID=916 RepID=A0ABX5M760_9PROT|nr:hypothetical protein C8R14_1119 [Nitrosomonas eutropha]SCX25368.1 hypothetical protein SAMN05216379_12713 [Nitrosomonas eutropha]SDX06504.1 hypothetical protein SAMN05216317_1287 [Nitrosomonas eutropha]
MPHEAIRMDAAFHQVIQKNGESRIGLPLEQEILGRVNKFHGFLSDEADQMP